MSKKNQSRIVGVIGKLHGINGYVYVTMLTDYPDTITKGSILFTDTSCKNSITVEDIKKITLKGKKRIIFKFAGFKNPETAQGIIGKYIYRLSIESPELKNNNYWIDDLKGCKVYLKYDIYKGIVTDIENYAFNDNITIRSDNGILTIVPFIDDYIESIDIKNKKIVLKKIPEYL